MVWNHVFQTSCIIPFSCSKQCKMNLKHDSLSLQLCPYSGRPFLQRVWDGKEGCVLFGGGDRGYGWGLGGWVGLFSPQRQNAPSPHPTIHSLPPGFVCPEPHSSLFCHPAIPLCLAYTMGAQCSAPDAAFCLRTGERTRPSWGDWGRVRGDTGGQEHSLTKCHPPNYHPHQPPGTYQTHTHTYTDGALKTSAIRPDHGTRQKNNPKQTSVPITPAVALCCDGSTGAWLSLATYVFSLSLQWAAGHRAHAVF